MRGLVDLAAELPGDATVVRVLSLSGFGSRHAGEAVAVAADGSLLAGRLLAGSADGPVREAVRTGTTGVVAVDVGDPDAAAAGLACGGRARLLLQPVRSLPAAVWDALQTERPTVVATVLADGATRVVTADGATGSVGAQDAAVDERARELLRAGRDRSEERDGLLVESFVPPTTVRVVGHAVVGEALARQAALLDWRTEVADGPEAAAAAGAATQAHDALVVLSHDPDVDTPALGAALRASATGYVGALGSRHTQAARRDRLRDLGFGDDDLARIHGPVGLDLGARTPAETAVAIVAEVIAHQSCRAATPLSAGGGPING